ncbi:MAG: hypothetical protein JO021_08515 [Alphaproteobacteria bacterium]|nr:hypothetical protein [Alphaproteobacteria bacterium]
MTGQREIIARNGFALTIGPTGQIEITKFDLERLNRMLAGLLGRSGRTGGASSPPNQNSAQAQRLADSNSSQPPTSFASASAYSLGSIHLPNTTQLVALASQNIQTGAVVGGGVPVLPSGSYGFGLSSPAIAGSSFPVTAGLPLSNLTYSSVLTQTSGSTTFTQTNVVNQTSTVDITLSGGIPQSLTAVNSQTQNSTITSGSSTSSFTSSFVNRISTSLLNSKVAEIGGDTQIQFGRLTGGNATFAQSGTSTFNGQQSTPFNSGPFSTALAANQSSHYIIGVPPTALPTAGSFTYALAGASSPTFADGSGSPGKFTGSLNIAFGQQPQANTVFSGLNGLVVGLDATVTMPGDATYRLVTVGGLNVAPQIAQLQAGTGTNTIFGVAGGFSGILTVAVSGSSRACGTGTCNALVAGILAGPNGGRAGLVYALGTFNQTNNQLNLSQIIQGAAIFRR